MTAASFTRTARPARSGQDSNLVQALQQGPVAMAFEIKGGFSYYKTGVLSIRNCGRWEGNNSNISLLESLKFLKY